MKIRMFPPHHLPGAQLIGGVDAYRGEPGQAQDIPEHHAPLLRHWTWIAPAGPTSDRPLSPVAAPGSWYVDLTLGAAIVFDGYVWRDPLTSAAV